MSDNRSRDYNDILNLWTELYQEKFANDTSGVATIFYGFIKAEHPHLLDDKMTDADQYEEIKSLLLKSRKIE